MQYHTLSFNQLLTEIDIFIDRILNDNINTDETALVLNNLYPEMKYYYDHRLVYTKTVKWFIDTCGISDNEYCSEIEWNAESVEQFIYKIKKYLPEYFQSRKKFALKEKRRTKCLKEYLTQLTEHYSRLLFVRVDLHYRLDYQDGDGIYSFAYYMTRFKQHMSNKKGCFEGLEGYAWSLEQGYQGNCGLHCHLFLAYNGHKHENDSDLGIAVGEKWMSLIEGQGHYFNCNDKNYVNQFERLKIRGVGRIYRADKIEVQNAIKTISYLTTKEDKYEQRLKAKLPGMRSFGRSQFDVPWRRSIKR